MLVGPPAAATVFGSTRVTMSKWTVWPLSRSPSEQVTTCPAAVHPAGGLRLLVRYASCAGRVSVTVTSGAASGPLLVTVMCQVSCWPAMTGLGEWVLVTARSACGRSISHIPRPLLAEYALPVFSSKKNPVELCTATEPRSCDHVLPPLVDA